MGLAGPEEVIGTTDYDVPWLKENAEAYRRDDLEVMEGNKVKPHIIETVNLPDGSQMWVDTTKVPLTDNDGRVTGILGIYEDITERKRMQEAVQQSELKWKTLFSILPVGYRSSTRRAP